MFRNIAVFAVGTSALKIRDSADNVRANLIAGAKAFDAATQALTYSPEQAEVSKALQSAALSGSAGGSATGAASFVQAPGKISQDKLASIAAAVEASAASHVANGRAARTCGTCTPNFSVCPSGFVSTAGGCAPSASYNGFCNKPFALGDYSSVELEEFEVFCDSCFPCHSSFLQGGRDSMVKDGLFVTQPLRSDEQVRVNVIEKEPSFASSARTVAAASTGAYLRAKFNADLAKLRSSFLKFNDIRGSAGPVEVINFSIESGIPDALAARRASRRSFVAQSALNTMMATEQSHAARVAELLA